MKIAILTDGKSPIPATNGGAVENLIELLLDENEEKRKFDFSVFGLYEENAYQESLKYKKTQFKFVKSPLALDYLDKCIYLLAKYILKKVNLISYRFILRRLYVMSKYPKYLLMDNYDRVVILTNSTLFLLYKNKKVFSKYKNKTFYYLHNEVRSLFGCRKEIEAIHGLIGVSKFVNEAFLDKVPGFSKQNCFILKNCVDVNSFMIYDFEKVEEFRRRYSIYEDDFVVIFAGRLIREKGALEVIEAIKLCNRPKIKLLIVGSGFYRADIVDDYLLELKNASISIIDKVIFTGYIDYADMPYIYKIGNVAVLPSIWNEPAGMTMVEAVISGLPLITTNSGGIPEYIPNNVAVILDRDQELVNNLKHAICRIMDDRYFSELLCSNGEILKDELNRKNFYKNFEEIIER